VLLVHEFVEVGVVGGVVGADGFAVAVHPIIVGAAVLLEALTGRGIDDIGLLVDGVDETFLRLVAGGVALATTWVIAPAVVSWNES